MGWTVIYYDTMTVHLIVNKKCTTHLVLPRKFPHLVWVGIVLCVLLRSPDISCFLGSIDLTVFMSVLYFVFWLSLMIEVTERYLPNGISMYLWFPFTRRMMIKNFLCAYLLRGRPHCSNVSITVARASPECAVLCRGAFSTQIIIP